MARFQFKTFRGLAPKVAPRTLMQLMGQTAQNCDLSHDDLRPIKGVTTVEALPDANRTNIYLWRRGGSSEWLSFLSDVDVRQGPLSDDPYSRIYYTDGTTLHMKLWDTAKVEVADVSITKPAAPAITKTTLFDFSNLIDLNIPVISGSTTAYTYQPTYSGYQENGNVLSLKFTLSAYDAALITSYGYQGYVPEYSVRVRISTNAGGYNTLTGSSIYSTISNLSTNGVKIATVQVVDITQANTSDVSQASKFENGEWTYTPVYGIEYTVNVRVDTGRSATQYQYYCQTTVNAYGQESPPSDISALVEWGVFDKITIAATTAGRLYRSAAGTTSDDFFFVAENPGGAYVDSAADAALSETIPVMENPPANMSGLVTMPGGFFAAFYGKDIYFSEPWIPYSWPTRYRLTIDFDIVGLAVSGNDLIVLTKGNPYYISGSHPETMTQSKMAVEQSCVAKRSIAYAERYVVYASPDGLVGVSGGSVQVLTQNLYTRDQWQALTPSGMVGSVHDGRYIAFHATGGIILDFLESGAMLTTTNQTATGAFPDIQEDTLYLIQSSNITSWRTNATVLTATWRSKMFQAIRTPLWSSAIVIADTYLNTVFKLYGDGVLLLTYTVPSNVAFRLPKSSRIEMWELQIETQDTINEVVVATSMNELRAPNPMSPQT